MENIKEYILKNIYERKNEFNVRYLPDFESIIKYEPIYITKRTNHDILYIDINDETDYNRGVLVLDVKLETGKGYGSIMREETQTYELLSLGFYKRDIWKHHMLNKYSDFERICLNIIDTIIEANRNPDDGRVLYSHLPNKIIFNINQELD